MIRSKEDGDNTGHLNTTWFYNSNQEAIRAEKDTNGDRRVDTWYFYEKGKLKALEEDTNRDGKPDLWEEYDESESLIKSARDLNFDGRPDVERSHSGDQARQY